MICKIRHTIAKYNMIQPGMHIIVALSGGADSVSLLYALYMMKNDLGITISAAHVNHGIRDSEADSDEKFVVDFCNKLGIEIITRKYNIPSVAAETGEGLEECGRRIRYDFLDSLCDSSTLIATAHNLNDRTETFIYNFTRGSGLNGLCSIPPKRDNIIRPLIDCSREEIEKYCVENGLEYVTDKTNFDINYSRNRIRHNVIPQLRALNSSLETAAQRCIESINDDNSYLDKIAQTQLDRCRLQTGYDVSILNGNDISVRKRIIYKIILENTGIRPDYNTILSVNRIVENEGILQIHGGFFVRVKNNLIDFPRFEKQNSWCYTGNNRINELPLYTIEVLKSVRNQNESQFVHKNVNVYTLDCDKINGKVLFRSRLDGDKIKFAKRNCTKTLKKLFNEYKISADKRNDILICSDDEGILFVDGFGVAGRCAVTSNTVNIITFLVRRKDNC